MKHTIIFPKPSASAPVDGAAFKGLDIERQDASVDIKALHDSASAPEVCIKVPRDREVMSALLQAIRAELCDIEAAEFGASWIQTWRNAVEASEDLEVDHDAVVADADDGVFVQSWAYVSQGEVLPDTASKPLFLNNFDASLPAWEVTFDVLDSAWDDVATLRAVVNATSAEQACVAVESWAYRHLTLLPKSTVSVAPGAQRFTGPFPVAA